MLSGVCRRAGDHDRAGDGPRACDLLAEVAATAGRLDGVGAARARANLLSHRVSVEQLFGEPGAALQHAGQVQN